MHYLIYKITNSIDKKIYIGAHQTDNVTDDYMGSGLYIKRAIAKYGLSNFTKEILFDFRSKVEMFDKERELVNEDFVKRCDNYNIKTGGNGGGDKGYTTTLNHGRVTKFTNDMEGVCKGKIAVYDEVGNIRQVTTQELRDNSNLTPTFSINGNISVVDNVGNRKKVTKKEFDSNPELRSIYANQVHCKTLDSGEYQIVTKSIFDSDPNLVGRTKGENNKLSKYEILDECDNVMYTVENENFTKFLKDNNLPSVLKKSHQTNTPIFQNLRNCTLSALKKTGMLRYKGWRAKRIL